MIGGILANSRHTGAITTTVWVAPGLNLRFLVDIKISRHSGIPGGGDLGITDLILSNQKGGFSDFTFRLPTNVSRTLVITSILFSSGDSLLFRAHQENVGGALQVTRSVNVWVVGREVFKSDFFETR